MESDPDTDGRAPIVVIAGRPFAWDDVGRMLMTFAGFTIDLRIDVTVAVIRQHIEDDHV